MEVLAVKKNASRSGRYQPDDAAKGGGLSRTVSPKKCHALLLAYLKGDALNDMALAVKGMNILQLKHSGILAHNCFPPPR